MNGSKVEVGGRRNNKDLTSRFVRLVVLPGAERFDAVEDRGCTFPVPGEFGRMLGGGPGSAPGERRCVKPR